MAKARVGLKHLSAGLKGVLGEIQRLKGKTANPNTEKELRGFEKQLTSIQKAVKTACNDTQFRSFELAGASATRRSSTKRARTTRTTR